METTRHIGVDLHRNCFTACIRLENGRNYLTEWKLEQLPKFVAKLRPNDEVAVEVTGNTRLFHDAVAPHIKRVVAVNPNQFKVITHSVKKTDPNDARNLALYLAKDLLPEVHMKDKTRAQIASLTQTRDTMVKLRTALKNKINNIFSAHGINLSKESLASEKGLKAVLETKFDLLVDLELKILVEQIRALNKSIAELKETIGRESQKLEGHKNLTSIKGIGGLSAGILLSIIGDIRDFSDEGKLAAYFGIVPRISNSNETERSGRITKSGTKLGRTTLVQCALIAQRYSPYLKNYYERKKSRGTGKAIIALARKFLGIIYRTLKNDWVFEDFPNFILAEEAHEPEHRRLRFRSAQQGFAPAPAASWSLEPWRCQTRGTEPRSRQNIIGARPMLENSTLIAYNGKLTWEELANVPTPPATATHIPIPHLSVVEGLVDRLVDTLSRRHIGVVGEEYAVSKDGMETFGVIDLETSFDGCRFAIGIRNANNKRFRLSCTVGLRVFVCENLAFQVDYSPVLAKHSKHFSLEDSLSVGVDRMQRNFEPMRRQVES